MAVALALALAAPAYYIFPWQGVVVHFGAAVLGLLVGHLWAAGKARRYEASLRGTWAQWMRFAVSCETVAEVHRKVEGRSGRNRVYLAAAGLTFLWALEVALLFLAFQDTAEAAFALPVLALNGLLSGALAGHALRMASWTRTFRASMAELVESGEVGVWGVV